MRGKVMTQLKKAQAGIITEEMVESARAEGVTPEFICQGVAEGTIVLIRNTHHRKVKPLAIGKGLRTKVNANIGTSQDRVDLELELKKLAVCVEAGADAVMDLSTGGDIREIRRAIIAASPLVIGTVPIYQAAIDALSSGKAIGEMTADDFFRVIEEHGAEGVDFITVHCGVTKRSVAALSSQGRLLGIVSRGGSILANWMACTGCENPLYEDFDRLLEIAARYEMVLSLGDGLRPGCLADASDRGQIQELVILGELAKRARKAGVQVMIEGPGHVPLRDIEANILMEKALCEGAPFYVLGPLPTDIAAGYDHIACAVGGAIAGAAGADFLCYVTPSEHLRLPTLDDVREGIIAARIAAHIADLAKGLPEAWERDRMMAQYRRDFNWDGQVEMAIDPSKARALLERSTAGREEGCTMCGDLCAIKLGRRSSPRSEDK